MVCWEEPSTNSCLFDSVFLIEKVLYNLANTYYKQDKFDKSVKEYALLDTTEDKDLLFRSYYNLGNSLYKTQKLNESLEAYKKALDLKPDDIDTKHNIEVLNQLKKEQEKQQQQQQKDQEKKEQEKKEQQKKQEQKQQEKKEQEKKELHRFVAGEIYDYALSPVEKKHYTIEGK